MAIRTSCFLNLPPSSPSSPSKTTTQLPCSKKEVGLGRLIPSVTGVASLIIGLEMVSSVMIGGETGQYAIAKEKSFLIPKLNSTIEVAKWSDRRMCPPWHLNSLESIVPENLPRPSARRRWESISHATSNAPSVKFALTRFEDCFSM